MRRSTLIAATATMAATVLFAGCGTSSDSSSTDNSSSATSSMAAVALSKPDFIKAADAICAADNSQASQSASSIPAGPSGAEQQKDLFLSTYRTELQKLRALTPPPEDQAAVNDIWNALDQGLSTVASSPAGQFENPSLDKANQLAKAYGMKVCGS